MTQTETASQTGRQKDRQTDRQAAWKLPPATIFPERLGQSTSASALDPCSAQVVLKEYFYGAGFGSKINNLVNSIVMALTTHDTPQSLSLCAPPSNHFAAIWLSHFSNALQLPICTVCDGSDATAQLSRDLGHAGALQGAEPEILFSWKHAVLDGYFVLTEESSKKVNAQLGQLLEHDYIGIHIRHAHDKESEAARVATAKYAEEAKKASEKYNIRVSSWPVMSQRPSWNWHILYRAT